MTSTGWLTHNRRRALLATVGVGTIDQALLSVFPVKFQTLRHFGLSSKLLIVDEVHELGEPYIAQTLAAVLRMHRAAGGSAILLTATLPLALRKMLLKTYGGRDDGDPSYPSLHLAGGASRRDLPQETGSKGTVRVERLENAQQVAALLAKHARNGAACVWIRNAVDDAINAVELLRAQGIEADLLHARFALGDRKRIETRMLARFGKTGTDRAGRVLVGTQVLESSLDLDFDVMVSDLAPMAGLIQRCGRLWRHMDLRPAGVRPVPLPVLYVLSPDPEQVDCEHWLSAVLERGSYTYSADLMWRTAWHVFAAGEIIAPSGIRSQIERAYSDQPPTPPQLKAFEKNRLGEAFSHENLAHQNIVKFEEGYRRGGKAHDDTQYPTRLGEAQQTLVLTKEVNGTLVPLFAGEDGWSFSEITVAKRKLEKLVLPDQKSDLICALTRDWKDWQRESKHICVVSEEGRICDGLRYCCNRGLLFNS